MDHKGKRWRVFAYMGETERKKLSRLSRMTKQSSFHERELDPDDEMEELRNEDNKLEQSFDSNDLRPQIFSATKAPDEGRHAQDGKETVDPQNKGYTGQGPQRKLQL